jgi:dihydrofolate reductase
MAVFVDITMSLDGFVAGPGAAPGKGLGEGGDPLHNWVMQPTAADQALADAVQERVGAEVIGRNVYDHSEGWGDADFGHDCFVLTHRPRPTEVRGAGRFHFVETDIVDAVERARAAAGDKDVLVMGGADVIRQSLTAGLIDDLTIHVAPILLGAGNRLFDHLGGPVTLAPTGATTSEQVTHLQYRVVK